MTVYRCRKGGVLTEICNESLLVASKTAREYCPYVKQVNETAAVLWKAMTTGAAMEDLMDALQERYEIPDREGAMGQVGTFLKAMIENGYVLKEESDSNSNGR